jgi:hemolysin III
MLDHCAIFLLIAGTYTPFVLVNMRGPTGWLLFTVVWGLALAGITLKLVFGHRYKALRVLVYLAMGWLILFAAGELNAHVSAQGIKLMVAGGITYTLGVVFYLAN